MKIRPLALGIALGAVWGVSLFLTTLVSYFTGYGEVFLNVMAGSIYPGYSITPKGSLIGLFFGFLDGVIGGGAVGLIYNFISSRMAETARMDEEARTAGGKGGMTNG